jgi:hypothetical protein
MGLYKLLFLVDAHALLPDILTLNLLTSTIVAPSSNASKWQMGFNSVFKELNISLHDATYTSSSIERDQNDS